jgi:hypothetical protein
MTLLLVIDVHAGQTDSHRSLLLANLGISAARHIACRSSVMEMTERIEGI